MAKKPTDLDDVLQVIGDFSSMVAARFDEQEKRFDGLDKRFDGLDARLFRVEEDVKELKSDMTDVKQKINHIYNVLDSHMRRIEDILIDNKTRYYQQDRMERWIFQLADKMNVKLKYE